MATTAEIERVEAKIIAQQGAKLCDKYDYLVATGCARVPRVHPGIATHMAP